MGQKAGAGTPLLDRARRQGGLGDRLANLAGQAGPDDPFDHEATGDVVQFLGHVIAQNLERAAAVLAGLARREHRLVPLQVIRQGLAPGVALLLGFMTFGSRRFVRRFGDGRVLGEGHLQLIQALRA